MGSILEFLKETENILNDDSIDMSPYAKSSATELTVYRNSLEKSFNDDPYGSDTRTWYTRANNVALGLEWHLAVTNQKYLEKVKYRQEAEVLFKSMQVILADYNMRQEQFIKDEIALAEFAIVMNDAYKYYKKSLDFVWNRTVYDDTIVEKIKAFMEEYNHGVYFKFDNSLRNTDVGTDTSEELSSDDNGSVSDLPDVCINKETDEGSSSSVDISADDMHRAPTTIS